MQSADRFTAYVASRFLGQGDASFENPQYFCIDLFLPSTPLLKMSQAILFSLLAASQAAASTTTSISFSTSSCLTIQNFKVRDIAQGPSSSPNAQHSSAPLVLVCQFEAIGWTIVFCLHHNLTLCLQGRWIPYTEIKSINVFDPDRIGSEYVNLLGRVRGTLFFMRNMLPNNNKLMFMESAQELVSTSLR